MQMHVILSKNQKSKFLSKSELWPKTEILVKKLIFFPKTDMFSKNWNVFQKL